MIPRADITEWRTSGFPWKTDAMVEQDLILSRLLVELFSEESIQAGLVFRGGTALHKLYLKEPLRYSEDIDLVQQKPGPIGAVFNSIRAVCRDWLGEPKRKAGPAGATLSYKVQSEDTPPLPLRIKIEINTRDHFPLLPIVHNSFNVRSRWYRGSAAVPGFHIEELLATKLRALYQRRKGRDLFDLATALRSLEVNKKKLVKTFKQYMRAEGHPVSAADFRRNLSAKLEHPGFLMDCVPIVRPGIDLDLRADFELIDRELLALFP
jgi:predicted nucleotidyltransferase component of viral defense system